MPEQTDNKNSRSLELCKRVVTTESFIAEAKEIYGDRYDYSKVEYKNKEHRVTIVCPVHDDFKVYARDHLDGKGCPKCEKGEKFVKKLQDKFGNKFGLEQFVYESSTAPVTLVCKTHGAFSRLPHQILNSSLGCPECANDIVIEKQKAAKKVREDKQKAREEYEKQRLNWWLQEREERKKKREKALKNYLSGRKSNLHIRISNLYKESVDEHIEGIRYGGWKTEYYKPYKLSDEEARKLKCYREGNLFYRFKGEAPSDFFREAYEREWSYTDWSFERFLSHRSCIVSFDGNDLIIQEDIQGMEQRINSSPYKPEQERIPVASRNLPSSFVAIDFETLYSQRLSVCSVGMVKYKDGEIADRYYSFVRPPFEYEGKSGKALTWIHGITKEMVANEKTFAELLPEIEKFTGNLPLVAHNASVEKCCIRDACAYYDIQTKLDYNNIIDTLPLSRDAEAATGKSVEGQGTHTIDAVCERFGIKSDNHHHALHDAEMAGNLFVVFREILRGGESEGEAGDLAEKKGGCLGIVIALLVFFASFLAL